MKSSKKSLGDLSFAIIRWLQNWFEKNRGKTSLAIGVWINDGRGGFVQDLRLYSAPEDRVLHSLRLDVPRQAIDENASRRVPACLPPARFVRAVLFPNRVECGTVVHCKFRFQKGPQYLRAPPTPSSIVVLI